MKKQIRLMYGHNDMCIATPLDHNSFSRLLGCSEIANKALYLHNEVRNRPKT